MSNTWTLDTLPTPALVIDANVVRANIDRMADYTHSKGINLRPHIKTHKLQRIAEMQLQSGAIGLTCAKIGEAEVMLSVANEILIAYPSVDKYRAEKIAKLAASKTVIVGIDSLLAAKQLSDAAKASGSVVGVLVDFDAGFHRTGVQSAGCVLNLAKSIDELEGLQFRGMMYFPGNISGPSEKQERDLCEIENLLTETVSLLKTNNLNCEIVSGGSTPTAYQSHLVPTTTEIRPGTYIFNDRNSIDFGVAKIEDCAARIVATVVSNAVDDQVVLDAGSKTLTSDRNAVQPDSGYGFIIEYPNAIIKKLSEEHGQVDILNCIEKPELGERVTIIPNHICPCVNLQNTVWWLADNQLEEITVDARGLLI